MAQSNKDKNNLASQIQSLQRKITCLNILTYIYVILETFVSVILFLSYEMSENSYQEDLIIDTYRTIFGVQEIIIGLAHAILGIQISSILKKDFKDFYDQHFGKLFTATSLLLISTWVSGIFLVLFVFTTLEQQLPLHGLAF